MRLFYNKKKKKEVINKSEQLNISKGGKESQCDGRRMVSIVCTNSEVEMPLDFLKQNLLSHYDTETYGLTFQPKKQKISSKGFLLTWRIL